LKNNAEPEIIKVKGVGTFLDSDNIIWSDWNEDYTKMFQKRVRLSTKELIWNVQSYFGKPTAFNDILFGHNEKALYKIKKQSGEILWQHDLTKYKIFKNHWGEEKKAEVNKLIGVWNKQLILQLNNGNILCIDSENGKLNWRKEHLDKNISNKETDLSISSFYNPIINIEKGIVYFLQGTKFLQLDLAKQEFTCNWSSELNDFATSVFIKQTAVSKDSILFTASQTQDLGKDEIIGNFDIVNNEISWQHKFSFQNGEFIPNNKSNITTQLDKLYVLDSSACLHIFKKQKN